MSFWGVELCSLGGGDVPFWGVEMCQIWGVEMCWDEVNYDHKKTPEPQSVQSSKRRLLVHTSITSFEAVQVWCPDSDDGDNGDDGDNATAAGASQPSFETGSTSGF